MKKLAMFVGGTALAAGVVLVPVGAASAATTHASTTAVVTHGAPRDAVPARFCQYEGGYVAYDEYSPSGYVCVGGMFDGEPVFY